MLPEISSKQSWKYLTAKSSSPEETVGSLCQIFTPGPALKIWHIQIFPAEKIACYFF